MRPLYFRSLFCLTLAWACAGQGAHAQDRATDPLRPIASCLNRDGFHIEKMDRLPASSISRPVQTPAGPARVSTADGYRLMVYRKSSAPLVNLKVERSAYGQFGNDRKLILAQMGAMAASSFGEGKVGLDISRNRDIEILSINNVSIDHSPGIVSMVTLLDSSTGTVATAYVLNQLPAQREFADDAAFAALRESFIGLLVQCMAPAAQ